MRVFLTMNYFRVRAYCSRHWNMKIDYKILLYEHNYT